MKSYTNKLFLFESINLKISKIYVCKLIIIYEFGNPLKYGIGYFFHFIYIFPGKYRKKNSDKNKKIKVIIGQI